MKRKQRVIINDEIEDEPKKQKKKYNNQNNYREMKVTAIDLVKIVQKVKGLKWNKYRFELWVDCKEPKSILDILLDVGPIVKQKALPVGDYWFVLIDDGTKATLLFAIFERKSIPDLFSSMESKKGVPSRFRTQKANLIHLCEVLDMNRSRVYYLIEHAFVHVKHAKPQSHLKGAKMNIVLRDRLSVIETLDQTDTIYTIFFMIWKIHAFLPDYRDELSIQKTLEETQVMNAGTNDVDQVLPSFPEEVKCTCHLYADQPDVKKKVFKPSNKKNLTDQERDIKLVAGYEGVGPKKARAIIKRFESYPKLCQYINSTPSMIALPELENILLESGRRLGPVTAQILWNHIFVKKV